MKHPHDAMMWNKHAAKYCLLILASSVLFSHALVSHQVKVMISRKYQPQQPLLRLQSTKQSGTGHNSGATSYSEKKSPESTFWTAITQPNTTTSPSDGIPAVHGLDKETGPLPPGAYRNIDKDVVSPCLITVGIHPPSDANDGQDVWREGVKNCQKLMDSGFNTFRVNNSYEKSGVDKGLRKKKRSKSPSSVAMEHARQRASQTDIKHQAEINFYQSLRQSTPSSVLRSCHFMVDMEVPSILSVDSYMAKAEKPLSPVPFGNGWMVRESVSNALLRTKGERLDTVVLEYCRDSPYHLDVLDILFEMKREGLIHSVSTKNFPPSLLQSALGCGFNIYSNDVCGNLMNTYNLQTGNEQGVSCNDDAHSRLVSAPLGGGLFTNQYRRKIKDWDQPSSSSKKEFNSLFDSCCKMHPGAKFDTMQRWNRYRSVMGVLVDTSFKYQASVESIALRWLLQLNASDSISVGSLLGMDFVEEQGGQPFNRHRDLRQVFTFSLDEDDMVRLCKVAGLSSHPGMAVEHEIDFTNKALWISP